MHDVETRSLQPSTPLFPRPSFDMLHIEATARCQDTILPLYGTGSYPTRRLWSSKRQISTFSRRCGPNFKIVDGDEDGRDGEIAFQPLEEKIGAVQGLNLSKHSEVRNPDGCGG